MKRITLLLLLVFQVAYLFAQEDAKVVRYPFKFTYTGNPIVNHMYTADPTARVWNDTLYVYCSTDRYPSRGCDLMDNYHVFSTPDLVTWTDHGEILSSKDVPWGRKAGGFMWAPDCVYKDGTYYYYFPHPTGVKWMGSWKFGIATSSEPARDFTVQGYIPDAPAVIDPNLFIDDDGQVYFYAGGGAAGHPCYGAKMNDNMMEFDGEVSLMQGLTNFHEGPFVFKRNDVYYMIYPDHHSKSDEEVNTGNRMHYATSNQPLGPWDYKGIILDPTGCGTSHGSVVKFKGQWYLFYHNSALSGIGSLRSICFDKLKFNRKGEIEKVVQTGDFNKASYMPAVSK
ncbi:MAG: family 43 glycosylhydrolase [Rikenellaceae bacterium]